MLEAGIKGEQMTEVVYENTRKFDSPINQKTLAGPIKPVFFCQISFNLL